MNMDIKKIDIDMKGENRNLFTRIAYLLDQLELLRRINEIRTLWFLDKKLIPYEKFSEWTKEPHYDFRLSEEAAEYYLRAKDKLIDDEELNGITEDEKYQKYKLNQKIAYLNPIDYEIEYFLTKNGLAPCYKKIVLKAVACGKIKDDDYEQGQNEYEYKDILNDPKFGFIKEKSYSKDTKSNIEKDREWFWMRYLDLINGKLAEPKTCSEVHEEWQKRCEVYNLPTNEIPDGHDCQYCSDKISIGVIEKAISRYKTFLQG